MCLIKKRTVTLSVISAALLATCWGAQAVDHATITISAKVVTTTCALDSSAKSVLIGDIPSGHLVNKSDETGKKEFSLNFSKCSPDTKHINVTLKGKEDTDDNDLFATSVQANGVGIRIKALGSNTILTPAKNTLIYDIPSKNQAPKIDFSASVVQTGKSVKPGDLSSIIIMDITYD